MRWNLEEVLLHVNLASDGRLEMQFDEICDRSYRRSKKTRRVRSPLGDRVPIKWNAEDFPAVNRGLIIRLTRHMQGSPWGRPVRQDISYIPPLAVLRAAGKRLKRSENCTAGKPSSVALQRVAAGYTLLLGFGCQRKCHRVNQGADCERGIEEGIEGRKPRGEEVEKALLLVVATLWLGTGSVSYHRGRETLSVIHHCEVSVCESIPRATKLDVQGITRRRQRTDFLPDALEGRRRKVVRHRQPIQRQHRRHSNWPAILRGVRS